MKNMYKIFTKFYRIKVIVQSFASNTWMCWMRGGGKLGITNHGRSRVLSFLQETEDNVSQQTPRIGVRPKQKSAVQDARDTLTDLPNFFFLISFSFIMLSLNSQRLKADVSSGEATKTEGLRIIKRGQQNTMLPLEKSRKPIQFKDTNHKNQTYSFDGSVNPPLDPQVEPESDRTKQAKKKIRGVAELYEKQFLRDMVKQMRSTVSFSDVSKPSFAEGYFSEQLDQEYVEKWGDGGGIGLGDMIYQQLISQYGPRMGISNQSKASVKNTNQ